MTPGMQKRVIREIAGDPGVPGARGAPGGPDGAGVPPGGAPLTEARADSVRADSVPSAMGGSCSTRGAMAKVWGHTFAFLSALRKTCA
ncbi:hypothetical protein TPA0910_69060 [Streptomyces hygroscopicus subsp. sporocinereus]|uniref:Uncharacterized protein n=1 Tax=Streptomyces hygroscopicus TaxID=1912 RepID=A0ABQ3UA75_STRHY|nr:hypothetical protein TPA0910_69060 [Streptomyces hygroscopicus]